MPRFRTFLLRYQVIARSLHVPLDDVFAAAKFISGLDPRPGSQYGQEDVHYIIPPGLHLVDVFVLHLAGKSTGVTMTPIARCLVDGMKWDVTVEIVPEAAGPHHEVIFAIQVIRLVTREIAVT